MARFLIAAQDFNGLVYDIPNVVEEDVATALTDFIGEMEDDILLKLLGTYLQISFYTGLDELPDDWTDEEPYDTGEEVVYGNSVYASLIDGNISVPKVGVSWSLVEENNRWLLLKNGDVYTIGVSPTKYTWGGMKRLLRPYVYLKWVEFTNQKLTSSGYSQPNLENSTLVSPAIAFSKAHQDYVVRAGQNRNQLNTLYGYLVNKSVAGTFDGSFDPSFSSFFNYLNFVWQGPKYAANRFGL